MCDMFSDRKIGHYLSGENILVTPTSYISHLNGLNSLTYKL